MYLSENSFNMDVTIEGDLSTSKSADVTKSADQTNRPSFAEKLMSIKNSQCEQYLTKVQQKIDHHHIRNIQKIREETNRISYDFKEIKVNQKKRELEAKKKQNPYLDTEQDEFEIIRAEKYMVFNPNICFYTNKKNKIPIRSQAKLDPFHLTATVAKARKILQDMSTDRQVQNMQEKRALMHSRKSAHSVRFNIQHESDEQENYQNVRKYGKFRSPSPGKNPSPSPTYPKKPSTPHSTTMVDPNDIPDDFIQCSARHVHAYSKMANKGNEQDTDFHLPSMTSQQRTQSYLSTGSGKEDLTPFKELEKEVPAHELRLLKEVSNPHQERASKSAVMRRTPSQLSHSGKRYTSASTASSKKKQFTHSVMRRENKDVQIKVQCFLKSFDKNKQKRLHCPELCQSPEDKQTVTFDVPDGESSLQPQDDGHTKRPVSETVEKEVVDSADRTDEHNELTRAKTALSRLNPSTGEFQTSVLGGRFFHGAHKVGSALNPQEKPKRKTGIPHFSQDRSRRHTATFKLRRVVEELIKNRTTHQILQYEKMKTEGQDFQMPEQHEGES